jgi:hypothetical protein
MRERVAVVVLSSLVISLLVFAGCGDDGGDKDPYQLGKSAIIIVYPNPITFGAVDAGTEAIQIVTISNASEANGVLKLKSWKLKDATADLSLSPPQKTELAPGESTTMEVIYRPTDDIHDTGLLVLDYHNNAGTKAVVPINTLAQVGNILAFPSPISFGSVQDGTSKVIGVRLQNIGSGSQEVGSTVTSYDSSSDFKILATYSPTNGECNGISASNEVAHPFILEPDDSYCVDVGYTPYGGGPDTGSLQLYAPLSGLGNDQPVASILITGTEIGPEITILPASVIDFGGVGIGQKSVLSFTIQNDGSQDLTISQVVKGAPQHAAFDAVAVETNVAANTIIAPGASAAVSVDIAFEPQTTYSDIFGPLGYIEIHSDDGDEPTAYVTVFGSVSSPKLMVTPSDVVDFGHVAPATPSDRMFTLTNVGTIDLNISSLQISQNSPQSEFSIVDSAGMPGVIAAGTAATLKLRFTNKGGLAVEQVWGKIAFQSSDPQAITEVNLKATRADVAECKVILNPVALNFGTVPYGYEKTMSLNIVNIGSAPCSWSHATVHDGAAGPFGGLGGCSVGPVSTSKSFAIEEQPPAVKDLIKPGQSWPLKVKFMPQGNLFSGTFDDFSGVVQVHLLDFSQNPTTGVEVTSPAGSAGQSVGCNLSGKSGIANISAIPGEVNFGLTTVGCHSQTTTIKIYNTGKAPLSLCDIKLEACSPEVKLKNVPPIPPCQNGAGGIVLTMGNPIEVDVVYAPQDINKDGCALLIESNDLDTPALTVPLSGQGTYDDHQTDIFTQLSGQLVDVLFVVDNSGSMSAEQNSLSANFQSFISAATAQWQTDYHIGVITTDMDAGNNTKAQLMGNPRYVTTSDPVSAFQNNVKVGDFGSGTERGLMAMQTALSLPLSGKPNPLVPCQSNSDCTAPQQCVMEGGQKVCGGYNMGFLRKDATLEIVFVSDEEDQSPAALSFYVDFLKSLKGFANENLMHAHAIVGDPNKGCSGPGGEAVAGDRYYEVSVQTGGKFHSICDPNWSQKLADIGNVAFGLKVQFFLTRPAIPSTITVSVNGKSCTSGWQYQVDTNSVIFDENGGCMPQENDQIVIDYDVICYSE